MITTFLTSVAAIFIGILIILAGVYISIVERAPIWERLQVLMVGVGMYVGLLLILC